MTITSYDENKNEEIYLLPDKNRGRYKEYHYRYFTVYLDNIIEIYEEPLEKDLFDKEKIKEYFDIKGSKYYFKYDKEYIYSILKSFYRRIINYFPNKEKMIKQKNNKKFIQYIEKETRILDYRGEIGKEKEHNDIFENKKELRKEIIKNICEKCEHYEKHLGIYDKIISKKKDINNIKNEISKGEKNETIKILNNRLELLNQLNFIKKNKTDNNKDKIIDDKIEENKYDNYSLDKIGKASIEILSNDNVLIAEILFLNIFAKEGNVLSDEIIVPFLSSFVTNEKSIDLKEKIKLDNEKDNKEIEYLLSEFNKIYLEIVDKEKIYNLEESLYNRHFNFNNYYYIYSWMKGKSFSDICRKNEIEEGKLYNLIMRTFYFIDQIYNCYSIMENHKMIKIFENIKNKLLKGIMGVESLYLKDNIDLDKI